MLAVIVSHSLTFGRGACGACPGLSGLKAIGPTYLGLLTPRSPGFRCEVEAGANRDRLPKGNIMKIFGLVAGALLLAGCVSMGTDYDVSALDRLQVGMSKAQVIQMLGEPNQVINYGDGEQRLVWVHSTGSAFGAKSRSVGLPFSADGKLTDVLK